MAKWGDLLEDEEELPPSTTTGPDAKGVVTKVEYYRNEKGEVMKKTTKTRVVKIEKKVYKVAQERRAGWKKFGEAATERAADSVTSQTPDEVQLERIQRQKQTQEEKAKGASDFASAMAGSDKSAIVGSLRDMLYKKRMERQLLAAKGLIAAPERPPDEDGPGGSLPTAGSGKPGGWVPPSLRNRIGGAGGEGEMMQKRRDENSVRVSNLSEDVTEDDLADLFGPFGPIQRIFVAKDRETGESRGFAFINFIHREDALRAISKLDGFGYDNLILSVSMAAPRPERQ
ncbi:Eukaryotic translation initiation factor 3 subunit G [Chlorella sorokiniana]|uniref:Eukaryotic translation initiation factor 3 subunit G n=2 Tax=Chlorella TaxID=3071 RepID=A0A2P6TSF3_CHLSO|nr:Eukaryotic translation initiation factor 3 subunit G [Chlorella sorokiniana]|eukprot:PRW56974.1 Eukaryotic translation initiation factor 3 subunit G [Chlorella sorokiniana]